MSLSVVQICNLALGHIGDPARITSIFPPDGSIQAQHCNRFYALARDRVLEARDWNFARQRVELTPVDAPVNGEWGYAYAIPSDCVAVRKVFSPGSANDEPGMPFETGVDGEDPILFSDVGEAWATYTKRVETTGTYSAAFASALSYMLASYLAGPIIKGKVGVQVKQGMLEAFQLELDTAGAISANQANTPKQYSASTPVWIGDR